MKITALRATPVSVPLRAPLRHGNGCHWGRFVRTIVEVETDQGLIGLGEMGGGGESAVAVFKALEAYPYDQDPLRPGWAPLLPNDRFADPKDGRVPKVPV